MTGSVITKPEDLRTLVANAASGLREFDGLELITEFNPAALHVMADRIQIETVLANLLRNAAQAMRGSTVRRITLSTEAAEGTVFVRIEDTGPGISEACRERIFEPLFTTKEDGTGLGLSICQTIVDAHGGALWAESQRAGAGAVFMLALPVAEG
jgi:two-component system sensor kinase FixL